MIENRDVQSIKTKTKKLYYDDMYLVEFKAVVTKIEGNRIFLDQTAFFPRSGGSRITQISDIESKALTSPDKHDWRLAYELVCEYVPPAEISTFRSSSIAECVYDKDRGNFKTVLDDEFPLSKFHLWLQKQLKGVIA